MNVRKIFNIFRVFVGATIVAVISLWIGQQAYGWLPPQAAAESQLIDNLISFLVTLGGFIFLGVTGTLMYSIIFHRAEEGDLTDGPHIEGNVTLEIVWTAIPIMLVLWIAGYSYQVYEQMGIQGPMEIVHFHNPIGMESAYAAAKEEPPEAEASAVEKIDVVAQQWAWIFHYPEKNITSTELHLPSDRRVRLALTSQDVLHGFYIPAFRLKQDIVPNHIIHFEFTPMRVGQYRLTDSQYSGTYFATMQANVVVESLQDYHQWLSRVATQKPTPANNQAASEYAQATSQSVKTGWTTVAPAASPLVNYAGGSNFPND
ncbi:cytochrome c oxidase subunit II [Umezakia ovalisporum]|jgi:cytochrome c oxidase subunit 2|uniref:Cytochrome c oxidase subunit 2 n=2 Tax=Umezakia ovalisporum TaxID=75695 RepID=A0AA43GZ65_9CYAN|nr:cytochrome c oxidase subunit II [Umezakia ovalisporum]MBI1241801.1 cytochrome c oxidase subunit II [Nostoc sp. RI_552]MDH6056434.1 cytochrome c oxidase subunit II [Umezakia ovalisporum FSS-43]MDH6063872.1 cytochrome c oxidase subunit II [Umezakia ovalisporum FSS-62]MDH6066751.1 cytochrome c oxidase subunit II [Umezakia ovalisporum APH033B]MDH6072686.1 cytochrome c oxidase subunit II [Umezakia ovalisporum CobakiLakeA]